jgi:hypothetical protein
VKGQLFNVSKELLVKDSAYFERALNGHFAESKAQSITLDDILPEDFGFYVDIMYRHYFVKSFKLRKDETGGSLSTKQILTFWKLSDRFLNAELRRVAKESLDYRLSLYSEPHWMRLSERRAQSDLEARVARLQDAYHQCLDDSIPFADDIVQAAANVPGPVYAACVDIMDVEFMSRVSSRKILDLTLIKKRTADQMLG